VKDDDEVWQRFSVKGRCEWTAPEFYTVLVQQYNQYALPVGDPRLPIPTTGEEFIRLLFSLGMAESILG
jgi:hypothetical protein